MKLWLDVDDLFFFARRCVRPSGIQRLSGEVYTALVEIEPERVGFFVHDTASHGFRAIAWTEVKEIYRQLTRGQQVEGPVLTECGSSKPTGLLSRFLLSFSSSRQSAPRQTGPDIASLVDLRDLIKPGDVLCGLGAPWHNPSYIPQIAEVMRAVPSRFAMLVYDLIPIVRREYFARGREPNFEKFMQAALPLADVLLTISRSTANDVARWARLQGLELKSQPRPIPIGHGFKRQPASPLPEGLAPGSFVLFVSTIEVRKNHQQAFRIWSRLVRELPRERVPTLVFAGSQGWMVDDLMKAIDNTDALDGKLVLIHNADDAVLCSLYEACRVTLFPSLYEGWGLPVSDSLAFGKVCVASNTTSIPEAGGDFCLYIDPENTTAAYEVVRELIESPTRLRDMEWRLRTQFRPTPWSATARAILDAVA